MKKLLDELEVARDSADSIKEAQAVQLCINIGRAHNPWHEVGELPPIDEKEPDFSIDVLLTDGERCRVGYYAFSTGSWILHRYFKNPVTGWAYLPEGKP